jgi:TonB-linked SusC/RagA family outer membrane protein
MLKNPKSYILMLLLVLGCCYANAQDNSKLISGSVQDEKGNPLQGASISIKNVKNSTVATDANGNFVIKVPAAQKAITVSYVGMNPVEIALDGKTNVSVVLKGADSKLGEVVVVGYGTRRRSDVTTSISSISEKDIKNLPVAGIDQAMQGKVAGVTVTNNSGQPGGGVSVRVRGITSVNGNEPLYVIDGVPIAAQNTSLQQNFLGGGSGQTTQSVLATLNPADIASVDILKDASAQAIYGSRAANGVVLINTKRGKSGEGKISYDTYYALQQVPKKLKVMNLQQFARYQNSLLADINGVTGGNQDTVGEFKNPSILGAGTDWQDEIYQTGHIQSHQLAFSGGQGKTNYYFSGGYFDQLGTLIETKFRRYTLRLNVDHQVKSWFKAGISANLSRSNQKIGLSDGFDAVTSTVLYNSPAAPVRDVYGNFITQTIIGGSQFGNPSNPVAIASFRDVRAVNTKAFGALYGELEFTKGLTWRSEFNYDFNLGVNKAYQPFVPNPDPQQNAVINISKLREERNNSMYYAVKNYLNYNANFDKHAVFATFGHEAQFSEYDYINASRENLQLNLPSIAAGASGNNSNETIGAGNGRWSMESYFARLSYTFNNKYSINATVRRDGSSSFGPGKRWGTFPAVSASWTITNESFAAGMKNLSYLKLRVGAGSVGNQNVSGNNVYISNIAAPTTGPFGPGSLPYNVANPKIGWEAVKTYNAGIDATILNKRVEISIDVYKKVTTQMLLATQLGAFSGLGTNWNDIQTPIANNGQITNKGIDISITTYNIQKQHFNWKTTVVFSHYKNKLDFLNTPDATLKGTFDEYGDNPLVTLSQQGLPVGSFYGFVTDGLFREMKDLNNGMDWGLPVQADKQWLGDVRYKDLNGDNKIDDKDVTVIGNPNPKFTYGMTNTVSYKGIDLSVFIYGCYGAKIFNYSRRQTEGLKNQFNNQLETVLDRFTADNPGGSLPRYNQWHNNNFRISDRFIESGSFLRIQNISLGYNLPKRMISKAKLTNFKLYASVQNLYTFTKYSGYDPELGAYNSNVLLSNIDNGHYPNPRSFTIGANIEF